MVEPLVIGSTGGSVFLPPSVSTSLLGVSVTGDGSKVVDFSASVTMEIVLKDGGSVLVEGDPFGGTADVVEGVCGVEKIKGVS